MQDTHFRLNLFGNFQTEPVEGENALHWLLNLSLETAYSINVKTEWLIFWEIGNLLIHSRKVCRKLYAAVENIIKDYKPTEAKEDFT